MPIDSRIIDLEGRVKALELAVERVENTLVNMGEKTPETAENTGQITIEDFDGEVQP